MSGNTNMSMVLSFPSSPCNKFKLCLVCMKKKTRKNKWRKKKYVSLLLALTVVVWGMHYVLCVTSPLPVPTNYLPLSLLRTPSKFLSLLSALSFQWSNKQQKSAAPDFVDYKVSSDHLTQVKVYYNPILTLLVKNCWWKKEETCKWSLLGKCVWNSFWTFIPSKGKKVISIHLPLLPSPNICWDLPNFQTHLSPLDLLRSREVLSQPDWDLDMDLGLADGLIFFVLCYPWSKTNIFWKLLVEKKSSLFVNSVVFMLPHNSMMKVLACFKKLLTTHYYLLPLLIER